MKVALYLLLCTAVGLASICPALGFTAPVLGFGNTVLQNVDAARRMDCSRSARIAKRSAPFLMMEDSQHSLALRSTRRQVMSVGLASLLLTPSLVYAEKVEKVKPGSPAVALDMILTMKIARNLRLLEEKVKQGDFKAVDSFITNGWNSGSAAFLRKTKVLESLALGTAGTSGSSDLDADPAFANEKSPDSIKLEGMVEVFYVAIDKLLAAARAKSQDDSVAAYAAAVSALDAYLAVVGLPSVSDADPARIVTP